VARAAALDAPGANARTAALDLLVPMACADLGGSQLALLRLIDACAAAEARDPGRTRLRFRAWLFSAGPLEAELERRGIAWERLPRSWPRTPHGWLHLARRLRRPAPHLVYLHAGRIIALLARGAGIPCIERVNEPRAPGAGGWCRYRALDRRMTNWNARVLPVSEALRDELLDRGVAREKLVVMRDPVTATAFHRPDLRAASRASWGIAPGEFLVLTIGRLARAKGLEDLLDAAAICRRESRPAPRFLIAGGGPLRDAVLARVRAGGLADHVVVRPFQAEVASLYAAADLYLQTSRWEGLPAVLLEARAAGLPIVATDVGGTREALRDYSAATLVPARDAAAIAGAIRVSLRAAGDAPRIAGERLEAARTPAALPAEFAPEQVAARFLAIVADALAAARTVAR